jgi:hypothetical protein
LDLHGGAELTQRSNNDHQISALRALLRAHDLPDWTDSVDDR